MQLVFFFYFDIAVTLALNHYLGPFKPDDDPATLYLTYTSI